MPKLSLPQKVKQDPRKALKELKNAKKATTSEEESISSWEEIQEEEDTDDLIFAQDPDDEEEEVIEEEESSSEEIITHTNGPQWDPEEDQRFMNLLRQQKPRVHRLPTQLLGVKSEKWFGTHNTLDFLDDLNALEYELTENHVRYFVTFKEKAPTTGHIHCHSLLLLDRPQLAWPCLYVDQHGSWEKGRGTLQTIYRYISKDGEMVFEFGNKPPCLANIKPLVERRRKSDKFKDALERAKKGDESVRDEMIYAQYRAYFDQVLIASHTVNIYHGPLDEKNFWLYGPAGTGKTKMVWDNAMEKGLRVYCKLSNKWWDGYKSEKIVLMDDVTPEAMKYLVQHMKNWSDRYPFTAEVKGGAQRINSADYYLIVTSNYSIDECFFGEDLDPIKRRFKEFKIDENWTNN